MYSNNSGNENTSGHGPAASIPPGIGGWNWGAFFLSWIWGIFNGTYIALLCFVPFLNFIMMVILGVKGNEWAWRNKKWASVEDFHRVQKKWALASVIVLVLGTISTVGIIAASVFLVSDSFTKSKPYKAAMTRAKESPEVKEFLGEDIKQAGIPQGNFKIENSDGEANLTIPVEGSKGKGKLYIKGTKEAGVWTYSMIKFGPESSDSEVDNAVRVDLLKSGDGTN